MKEALAYTPQEQLDLNALFDTPEASPVAQDAVASLAHATLVDADLRFDEQEIPPSIDAHENPSAIANIEQNRPSLRERIFRSRLGRLALSGLAGLGLAGGIAISETSPAYAADHTYTVTGTGDDGVWLHGDPGFGDKGDLIKLMPEGTKFNADCYVNDSPVGPRNNPVWLHGKDEAGTTGYFTDYYSSSHWDRNNTLHDQGLPFCGEQKSADRSNGQTDGPQNPQPAESLPVFTEYNRQAAANWALSHATDTPPNAGSCTWFTSSALWNGGIRETPEWNNDPQGVKRDGIRYGTDIAWKASEFLTYAHTLPYVKVYPIGAIDGKEKLPDARLGDLIVYDWKGDGIGDHATIITGFSKNNPQYPLVSGWSEKGSQAVNYNQRGWTWSEKHRGWIIETEPATKAYLVHIRTQDEVEANINIS